MERLQLRKHVNRKHYQTREQGNQGTREPGMPIITSDTQSNWSLFYTTLTKPLHLVYDHSNQSTPFPQDPCFPTTSLA